LESKEKMANASQSLKEILYNLDPSDRVSFPIYQDESLSEGSEKYNLQLAESFFAY
jgi:hypothetical protein